MKSIEKNEVTTSWTQYAIESLKIAHSIHNYANKHGIWRMLVT